MYGYEAAGKRRAKKDLLKIEMPIIFIKGSCVKSPLYTVRHTGLQEFPNLNRCSKAGTYNRRVNYSRAECPHKPWRMIDANRV
jgi:hypothetical protein